jgi:hypothetical protein
MAKYKSIQELADAFKSGELKDWKLMVDNDNTYLAWAGKWPLEIDDCDRFESLKEKEANELWDSPDVYILDQALTAAGIPNEGV